MTKKSNKYRIKLEQVSLMKEDAKLSDPIIVEFDNHDDIFKIIEIMREKNLFEEKNHSIEFAIGIKMFGEVVLKNKNNPLFEEFFPAFGDFMKKLKSTN
ncbi:DUF3861 family protein [Chryseobacterium indologenes]|uniref:DUF3861 domain-containing protein n=1 Tax=Bacteroidota TaxID=976 RepID=UPI000F4EB890|nr:MULTISPECIES: DUF3861 domain-containing protein [Bacteroidota]AYZ36254.1 DUF3861 family protein [Chryseobacterium indologenes]MEB4763367.1 DUF3861 domain-containing protein [Chryseobacterium indologenes]RQO32793.1 DUF3861 domain-containing protein [Chryseobacterium sp. KBW03]